MRKGEEGGGVNCSNIFDSDYTKEMMRSLKKSGKTTGHQLPNNGAG